MPSDQLKISVIIPTYNRPEHLCKLLSALCRSRYKNYEVIVVDQSTLPISINKLPDTIDLQYHHVTAFKGAAPARNFGASKAKGPLLAFIDDDCIPTRSWLEAAAHLFQNRDIVGIEGRIRPPFKRSYSSAYRVVSNIGMEGIAFMTANLFVSRSFFLTLGGFYEEFNSPHFREDTDLGWRLQDMGSVVFSEEASVIHPVNKKKQEDERAEFFVHDALLFDRHKEKYPRLFSREKHYINTASFWPNFLSGFHRHHINYSLILQLCNNEHIDIAYFPMQILWDIMFE